MERVPLYFYTLHFPPQSARGFDLGDSVGEEQRCGGGRRGTQTDGWSQTETKHLRVMPGKGMAGGEKKGAGVGRLRVPSRDREQKGEGCGPDQVGAA